MRAALRTTRWLSGTKRWVVGCAGAEKKTRLPTSATPAQASESAVWVVMSAGAQLSDQSAGHWRSRSVALTTVGGAICSVWHQLATAAGSAARSGSAATVPARLVHNRCHRSISGSVKAMRGAGIPPCVGQAARFPARMAARIAARAPVGSVALGSIVSSPERQVGRAALCLPQFQKGASGGGG